MRPPGVAGAGNGTELRRAGLGLAIEKAIMVMHGGNASIESAPGQGTSVTLQFPEMV